MIYHIALAEDWERARSAGAYRISTRGRTLEQEGFIHCSRAGQVAAVADRFYRGVPDLVLLTIDERLVRSEVRYESSTGAVESFPHIYGPLDVEAVVSAEPFTTGD